MIPYGVGDKTPFYVFIYFSFPVFFSFGKLGPAIGSSVLLQTKKGVQEWFLMHLDVPI